MPSVTEMIGRGPDGRVALRNGLSPALRPVSGANKAERSREAAEEAPGQAGMVVQCGKALRRRKTAQVQPAAVDPPDLVLIMPSRLHAFVLSVPNCAGNEAQLTLREGVLPRLCAAI
jgi:hypothetical protein